MATTSTHLTLTQHKSARFVVLIASGEIDLVSAPMLRRELAGAAATGHNVVLDLSGVTFFSSAAFEAVRSVSLPDNKTLSVLAPDLRIRRTFEILDCPDWIIVHAYDSNAALIA